jgi:hypothetical protein
MRSERRFENVGPSMRAEIYVVLNRTIIGPAFRKPAPGIGRPGPGWGGSGQWAGRMGALWGRQPRAGRGAPSHLCPTLRGEGGLLAILQSGTSPLRPIVLVMREMTFQSLILIAWMSGLYLLEFSAKAIAGNLSWQ